YPKSLRCTLYPDIRYFFLHLYRTNLHDIKYFNNELTNLQLKKIAADLALGAPGRASQLLSAVCTEFSKTERNFVLRRGERQGNTSEPDLGANLTSVIKEVARRTSK